jgi:MFS family permease
VEEVATAPGTPRQRAATFHEVFQVAEFRALFAAHLLSLLGDQLAKVALAVLVYSRTSSPLLTAASNALGYLPWLVGGPLLATVADLLPRRRVMVACDLAWCLLVLGMAAAVERLPVLLLLLLLLLVLVGLLAPPFEAARAATVPDVLRDERYVVGTSVGNMVSQSSQVLGFAVGGVLVAVVSARGALALNAATFLGSAVLVQWGHAAPARRC